MPRANKINQLPDTLHVGVLGTLPDPFNAKVLTNTFTFPKVTTLTNGYEGTCGVFEEVIQRDVCMFLS